MRRRHPSPAVVALASFGVLVALVAGAACSGDDTGRALGGTASTAAPTTTAPPSTGAPSPATTSTTGPALDAVVLACEQSIGNPAAPSAGTETVLDVVALPTSTAARGALQTSASGERDAAGRLFAKAGLVIRAGASFELIVPAEARSQLSIGWGSPAVRTTDLAVGGCPGTGWLAYAGGFWVGTAGCYPLLVRAGGQDRTVHVGVGAPCPGQGPPAQPSET